MANFGAGIDEIISGVTKLTSNQAINPIKGLANSLAGANSRPFMERGLHGMVGQMRGGKGFQDAAKHAFTKTDGKLAAGTIAASYIGASAGYRALSGGGAYRDKNGNTNIIGIPFV